MTEGGEGAGHEGGRPVGRQDRALGRVRRAARILDAAFRIPGTRFRVGWDALLGLVPGVGDLAGAAASFWIVAEAVRLGAPLPVLLRMLWNVGVETVLGSVPLIGDLFDAAWKANLRNVDLLERTLADPTRTRRRSAALLWGVLGGAVLLLVGIVAVLLAVAAAVLRTAWAGT